MNEPALDAALLDTIDAVLRGFGRMRTGTVERVSTGVLNANFRVESDRGPLFVRRMRDDVDAARARDEHRLIAWVRERGGPVAEPLENVSGDTALTVDGAVWAVFPWIAGKAPVRGTLSDRQVSSLGQAHGLLDRILAGHADSALRVPPPSWDAAKSMGELLECLEIARSRGTDPTIIAGMERQIELLECELHKAPPDFSGLPARLVHGDFHDQQAIFNDNEEVAAITDWEMFRPALRIRPVLRSLAFSELLHTPQAALYIEGYREHVRLPGDEIRAGVRLWRLDRLYATWVYSVHFLEGNERAGELLPKAAAEVRRLTDEAWWRALEERLATTAG